MQQKQGVQITGVHGAGMIPDGSVGFVEVLTEGGPFVVAFAPELGDRLAAAASIANDRLKTERSKMNLPAVSPLHKPIKQIDWSVDDATVQAVLRTDYHDGTSSYTTFPRDQITASIKFLLDAQEHLSR